MPTIAPPRIILGLHHVQISVPDSMEDAALRFYTEVMGFVPIDKPQNGRDRGPHCLQVGGLEIHLTTEDGVNRRSTKAHIAYRVDDLDYWRKRMIENEVTPVETPATPGFNRFEARDPFGNAIADVRGLVGAIVEVESTNDLFVLIDEDVTGNDAPRLIGQKLFVSLRELIKEFIAPVVNRLRKVRAVRHFELEDVGRVVPAKSL